jgi:hypothetical protein
MRDAPSPALHAPVESVRRPRQRIYGEEVLVPLRIVWATLGGPSGKRLAPFMTEAVQALERHGELSLGPQVRAKLLRRGGSRQDSRSLHGSVPVRRCTCLDPPR